MQLAGIPVSPKLIVWLSLMLRAASTDDSTADMLDDAVERRVEVVALTIEDREAILALLDDPHPPDGLRELHSILLAEHVEWTRAGLY